MNYFQMFLFSIAIQMVLMKEVYLMSKKEIYNLVQTTKII